MGNNAVISSSDLVMDDGAQILEAIRSGCVDAFVIEERDGHIVYTLQNADLPYSTLVQRMQQGAAMLNSGGQIIYSNDSLAKLLGISAASLIGVGLQDLMHADDAGTAQTLLQSLNDQAFEGEVQLRKQDGTPLPAKLSFSRLSRDGAIIGVLVNDLTTEKSNAELVARLQRLQDEERRNIARELHDSVGQLLAGISMNLGALQNSASSLSPSLSKMLDDSATMVAQVTKEIRTISHLLHPPLLGIAGLCSAIRWYVDGFSERSKIRVELEIPQEAGPLSSEAEIALFRVVQECLTNVYRHSGCDSCAIKLERNEEWLSLEIRDSGKGIPELATTRTGVGIRGMKERVRHLGGSLEVISNGSGTAVVARVPVNESVAQEQRSA